MNKTIEVLIVFSETATAETTSQPETVEPTTQVQTHSEEQATHCQLPETAAAETESTDVESITEAPTSSQREPSTQGRLLKGFLTENEGDRK